MPNLGREVERRGLQWWHAPVPDIQTPDAAFEASWPLIAQDLMDRLRRRQNVVVHCKGGLGRAGTIAARLCVHMGMEPHQAMALVRAARAGAIETRAQELYVLGQR